MTTLMYHHVNQNLQDVPDAEVDRMIEGGWRRVDRHEMVAIYNPALNDHKIVMRAEVATFANLGYYAEPTMVYHPEKAPGGRQVSAEEAKELYKDGWFDTPAKFSKADTASIVEKAVKAAKLKGE